MTQPSAGIPQTTYYSPSSFNGYGMNSYGQYPGYNTAMMPAATAWHPQMAWNPATQWNGAQWTAQMSRRDTRRYAAMARRYGWNQTPAMAYPPASAYGVQTAMRPWAPMNNAWNPAMAQRQYYGNAMMPQAAMMPAPVMVQQQAMYGSMPMVYGSNTFVMQPPMSTQMMPQTAAMNPMIAGDIMGDHEVAGPATASVPVIQNSWRGGVPITRASISRPVQMSTSRSYPNVVR